MTDSIPSCASPPSAASAYCHLRHREPVDIRSLFQLSPVNLSAVPDPGKDQPRLFLPAVGLPDPAAQVVAPVVFYELTDVICRIPQEDPDLVGESSALPEPLPKALKGITHAGVDVTVTEKELPRLRLLQAPGKAAGAVDVDERGAFPEKKYLRQDALWRQALIELIKPFFQAQTIRAAGVEDPGNP